MKEISHLRVLSKPVEAKELPKRSKVNTLVLRSFDMLVASLALVLFSPVMLLTYFLIKWENPKAPAIFKQQRVKKGGQAFAMYKFRSMTEDAEAKLSEYLDVNEVTGPMFKIEDDPRVTKLGKIIRKLSIDEFPQLWNVVKGDMSVVGPRPPLPREVSSYSQYDRQRLAIKPGCTGLWQVSGRNRLSFEEMVELDLYYIKHQSIWLNITILVRTLKELTISGGGM